MYDCSLTIFLFCQVIDYKAHPVLSKYLASQYSTKPFNVIIDIAGTDERLYDKSPAYLTPDGFFMAAGKVGLIHGAGTGFGDLLSFLLAFYRKALLPRVLGGVPRKGMFHSANINQEGFLATARLVEAGHLTGVVDSEYPMEDAVKVRASLWSFVRK